VPELTESRGRAAERLLDQMSSMTRRSRTFSTLVAHRCRLQPAQVQVLFTLYRATECRVAALAEHQLVDPSVVSRQIGSLEKEGLLTRRPDPDDGRAALVSLTDAGLARVKEVRDLHVAALAASVADWPDARIQRLADDLMELFTNADHAYEQLTGPRPANGSTGTEPANELMKELV
jgi:DNA-binding MarR family transcriptional regulator